MENFEIWSSEVWWEKQDQKLTLTSYVVKSKSNGKKNIIVLSSMPPLLGTESEGDRKKPAIVKFYDFRFWFKYLFLAQSPLMYLFDMKLLKDHHHCQ